MSLELLKEKWTNSIFEVEIGATKENGGTRCKAIKIGGEAALPYLSEEGSIPNSPKIAMEIWDTYPGDWDEGLLKRFGNVVKDPVDWANYLSKELDVDAINYRIMSASPDYENASIDRIEKTFTNFIKNVTLPLIITGSGDNESDNVVLARLSNIAKNEKCLFGLATQNNYKTLAVSANADKHSIIAESPIDINIAKQINILISDMGLDPSKIVMHPTTAALGYGMEYVYSIMERSRLAALNGDKMLSMPFVLFIGQEVWKVKEAKENTDLGINWEIATGVSMIQGGGDLLVLRHPDSAKSLKNYIAKLK